MLTTPEKAAWRSSIRISAAPRTRRRPHPVDVAAPVDVTKHVMMRVPIGWKGDLHRAPRRQLLVMLSGEISVEASSGPSLDLEPGDLLLLEDTVGEGHRTANTGGEPAFIMMVHLK